MHVPDLIRESALGQLIYYGSGRRLFRYAEEKEDFQVPEQYARADVKEKSIAPSSDDATLNNRPSGSMRRRNSGQSRTSEQTSSDRASTFVEKETALHSKKADDPEEGMLPPEVQQDEVEEVRNAKAKANLVDWYGPDDPESPMNVSLPLPC